MQHENANWDYIVVYRALGVAGILGLIKRHFAEMI